MRLIAGKWRGRVLKAPAGPATRPTADRTREALFSMLISRLGSLEGLAVADLFAGTGALGLEAMSRGAASCTFVEHDRQALTALRANVALLDADPVEIIPAGISSLGPSRRAFDLILFDPPYGSGGAGALLERLTRLGWASPAAWAAIETRRDEQVSAAGWTLAVERTYGIAKLSLLAREHREQPG